MVRRVEHIRQTSGVANGFLGLGGEFVFVTDTGEIRTHDGALTGGYRLLPKTLNDALYQPISSELTAFAAQGAGPGLQCKVGPNAYALRSLAAPTSRFTVTNPNGVNGNPTIDLGDGTGAVDLTGKTFNNGTYNGNGTGLTGVQFRFQAKTADYVIAAADDRSFIVMTSAATTGQKTFTLQALASYPNNFIIKLKSLNPRTRILTTGLDTIEGRYNNGSIPLYIPMGSSVIILKDASGFFLFEEPEDKVGNVATFAHVTNVEDYWIPCDGRALSRADYANLFAKLGISHGVGDGATTFNVPDAQGRAIIGSGSGAGLTVRGLGTKLGEETHLLTTAEIPAHNHGVTDPTHTHAINDPTHTHPINNGGNIFGQPGGNNQTVPAGTGNGFLAGLAQAAATGITIVAAACGITINNTGGGTAHNNMQPSLVLPMFVRA